VKPNHSTNPQPQTPPQTAALQPLADEDLEQVQGGGWRFLKDFEPPPVTPTVG
jgi:hypothetical protein